VEKCDHAAFFFCEARHVMLMKTISIGDNPIITRVGQCEKHLESLSAQWRKFIE
jgi:hypothetical protein